MVTGPYLVTTTVTKYSNPEIENLQDVIKIVNVTVTYSIGNRDESIDISTTITKED